MKDSSLFVRLVERLRNGDQLAAVELVRDFQSIVQREVRLRLEDPRLRRTCETQDFVQSIMASVCLRIAMGEFTLRDPGQLAGLLAKMTRNKIASTARREYALKRDQRRNVSDIDDAAVITAREDSPSQQLMINELFEKARSVMTDEESQMAEMRSNGASWEEVANVLGGNAQARRIQFTRGLNRVSAELGLGEH